MRTGGAVLVGRAVELDTALTRLRRPARDWGGPACFCVGEPGAGKSRLVAEIAERALVDGLVVVRGRPSSTGPASPLRPFAEALAAIQRRGLLPDDPLGGYRPLLGRVLPQLSTPSYAGLGEAVPIVAFAEAVLRVLTLIGDPGGCLLVLEDLQDADPDSLAVLEYLLDNVAGTPVALLGAVRDEPRPALRLLAAAERRGTADLLPIRPLDQRHTELLVAACLAIEHPPARLAELVWRHSGGNPLVVEELLYDMIDSTQLSRQGEHWHLAADPVLRPPPSMLQLVGDRTARLSATARRVLVTAAVYGEYFPLATVLAAAGGGETEALDAIQAATAAQLLTAAEPPGWHRFRHPLTHDAMLELAGAAERRQAAARLAEVVLAEDPERTGPTCRVAGRLLAEAGQPLAAGELHAAAGRQALRGGAVEWAVADLTEAVRLLASSTRLPAELIGELVTALLEVGRLDAALDLVERLPPVTDKADREQRALTHLDLAWNCHFLGREDREDEVRRHLAHARYLAGEDSELVRIHGDVIAACLELSRSGWTVNPASEQRARAAAEAAERCGVAVAACRGWYTLGWKLRERELDGARQCGQHVLALADRHDLPGWRLAALSQAASDSWIVDGDVLPLQAAQRYAQQLGMVTAALDMEVGLWLHHVFVGAGSLAPAMAALNGCAERGRRLRRPRLVVYSLAVLALAAAHRADRPALEEAQARLEATNVGSVYWAMAARGASAICLALEGRDDEALAVLHEVARSQQAGPYYLFGPHGLAVLLATLAGTTGPEEVAAALAGSAYRDWRWNRQFLHWAAAVLAGRRGELAVAHQHAALAAADAANFPVMRHLAARLVAPAAAAAGWGTPVADLRAAEAWFHDQGMPTAARGCRDVLRTLGAPVRQRREGSAVIPNPLRAAGVTIREYEVGLLIRERLGNRVIGERLHISPRTVEKHIAALQTKLDVPDRNTLIDRLADSA